MNIPTTFFISNVTWQPGHTLRVHRQRTDIAPGEPASLESEQTIAPGAEIAIHLHPGEIISIAAGGAPDHD